MVIEELNRFLSLQLNSLDEFEIIGEEEQEQKALTLDYNEKKGFRVASIISIIFVLFIMENK